MGLNKQAIKLIKKYQETKDQTIGSGRCKHYPSCSNYSIECYEKFNFIKASFLTAFRIIRCNPLSRKVYDPVPLTRKEKKELILRYNANLSIVKEINNYINNNKINTINDVLGFIYDYTFKDGIITDEQTKLFYDYLYVFKKETKKKNINLNYKEVLDCVNNYLSKPFHNPKKEDSR